jgi:hypothetical protein
MFTSREFSQSKNSSASKSKFGATKKKAVEEKA